MATLWKIPVVFAALVIGSLGACQVGWSGAEVIVNLTHRGIFGHFLLNLLMWIGLLVSIGAYLLVRRIAKPFLWVMVPIFLYCAVLLGAWDGIVSGFDAARANALKHHFANAYRLQLMSQRGRFLSCKDESIHFAEDAKAVCVQALQAGPGEDGLEGFGPLEVFTLQGRAERSESQTKAPSRTGLMVIKPQFNSAKNFSEGLAAVQIGDDETGKWGYVDKQGNYVLNPQFDSAEPFSEGLAAVQIGDNETGKWGYIDNQGNYALKPQFFRATPFSEGLAAVKIGTYKTGKYGYIDKQGHYVVKPQFDWAEPFSEELAVVSAYGYGRPLTGKSGYIDKQGLYVMKPQFARATAFSEGMAAVQIGDYETGKYGFIDKQGHCVINPQFNWAKPFSEELAVVLVGDEETGKWGFIYKQGSYALSPQFGLALPFSEGLAAVRIGDVETGKWGYIAR